MMICHRIYRLQSWLVRALIPEGQVGSYILYRSGNPIYVGRSDTDLRRRLVQHAAAGTNEYFRYDVHLSATHAFRAECSLYHAVDRPLANRIHPDAPDYLDIECAFCSTSLYGVLDKRLVANPVIPNQPSRRLPASASTERTSI